MRRRPGAFALLVLALLVAAPVTAVGDPGTDKARIDQKIGQLRGQIEESEERAAVLTTEISAATTRIRSVQADIDAEQSRLDVLEGELAVHQVRLDRLTGLFQLQTRRLHVLREQHAAAAAQLARRVREIYVQEEPDALAFVLEASSFTELLDNVDYLSKIGRQDERIAKQVERAKVGMAKARTETGRTRTRVEATTQAIAARTAEQRAIRDRLVASRDALAAARSSKQETLGDIRSDREAFLAEVDALQRQSAALASKIRAAQGSVSGSTGSGVSASGLIWPVNGPVTSGFGWRWGRMHEGIDIAVPSGTPVVASAAGTVIHAGWLGGYGNLVVLDHGNGISTAYAHNSGLSVGVGTSVGQGQVIAYSGNTGHSTGPHVHFEVRVNGGAVDPLGYL
jgi:murein DD-endopeptidase MepM/ murein hydrolase activator NlpD